MMRTGWMMSAALAALTLSGCMTVPVEQPEPVIDRAPANDGMGTIPPPIRRDPPPPRPILGDDPRDTRPVEFPRIAVGPKPRFGTETSFTRQDAGYAYFRFDDAVAVSEAIGDSPPDFGFRLYGVEAWAWADASGEMLIVEGGGTGLVQYFYAARSDMPVFARTSDFSFVYADGRLVGVLRNHGELVEDRLFNNLRAEGDQLQVRGRALYHAAADRRWDRETAVRWTAVQPAYGSWVTSWIEPPFWSHHYEMLRSREGAYERRERRREARERRRERAERFTRWRNGGQIGAPPGPGNGAGAGNGGGDVGNVTPPRGPGEPGTPGRPPRPPRLPSDGGPPAAPPPVDDPVRVVPPGPTVPTPIDPTTTPPRRVPPGWQGQPTEQPHDAELERREGRRPDRVMPEGPTDEAYALERQRAAEQAAAAAQAERDQQAIEAAERARIAREQAAQAEAERQRRFERDEAERAAAAEREARARDAEATERAAQMRAFQAQQAAEAAARQAEAERAAAERAEAQRAAQERAAAEAAARQAAAERAAQRAAEERAAAEAAASRSAQQPRSVDESAENVRPD